VLVVRKLQPLAVEMVVRGTSRLALGDYQAARRQAYGVEFRGMPQGPEVREPLTPSTKEEVGKHDEPISPGSCARTITQKQWGRDGAMSSISSPPARVAKQRGLSWSYQVRIRLRRQRQALGHLTRSTPRTRAVLDCGRSEERSSAARNSRCDRSLPAVAIPRAQLQGGRTRRRKCRRRGARQLAGSTWSWCGRSPERRRSARWETPGPDREGLRTGNYLQGQ